MYDMMEANYSTSAQRGRAIVPQAPKYWLHCCFVIWVLEAFHYFDPSDTNQSISKRQISNHISSFPRQMMVICGSHKFLIKKKCLFLSLTLFHGSISKAYKIIIRKNCYIFIYKYTNFFFFSQTNITIFKAVDCEWWTFNT